MDEEEDSEQDNYDETVESQSPETQLSPENQTIQTLETQEALHLTAMSAKLDISDYTRQMEEVW